MNINNLETDVSAESIADLIYRGNYFLKQIVFQCFHVHAESSDKRSSAIYVLVWMETVSTRKLYKHVIDNDINRRFILHYIDRAFFFISHQMSRVEEGKPEAYIAHGMLHSMSGAQNVTQWLAVYMRARKIPAFVKHFHWDRSVMCARVHIWYFEAHERICCKIWIRKKSA